MGFPNLENIKPALREYHEHSISLDVNSLRELSLISFSQITLHQEIVQMKPVSMQLFPCAALRILQNPIRQRIGLRPPCRKRESNIAKKKKKKRTCVIITEQKYAIQGVSFLSLIDNGKLYSRITHSSNIFRSPFSAIHPYASKTKQRNATKRFKSQLKYTEDK